MGIACLCSVMTALAHMAGGGRVGQWDHISEGEFSVSSNLTSTGVTIQDGVFTSRSRVGVAMAGVSWEAGPYRPSTWHLTAVSLPCLGFSWGGGSGPLTAVVEEATPHGHPVEALGHHFS